MTLPRRRFLHLAAMQVGAGEALVEGDALLRIAAPSRVAFRAGQRIYRAHGWRMAPFVLRSNGHHRKRHWREWQHRRRSGRSRRPDGYNWFSAFNARQQRRGVHARTTC